MTLIIVILPLIIVRGCSTVIEDIVVPEEKESIKIKVYIKSEDTVKEMLLEEYLTGVVAAEMPAEFELEALKAQAVAARTYAYGRVRKIYTPKDDIHKGADMCTDSAHCQAWTSKEEALLKWGGFTAGDKWNKIEKAVKETEGIIVVYDKNIVNPVFHANSGGTTENAEDVWAGVEVPYLKSVKSEGEEASTGYKVVTSFKEDDFINAIKKEHPDIKIDRNKLMDEVKILERTESDRVKTMRVGNVTLKGTDFRRLLNLRSTNFNIEKGESGGLKITTIGYGHGVGMSQWGANYLAKSGGTFEEIIKHYYKGVSLDTVENMEVILGN